MRLLLLNANTSDAVTESMVAIARAQNLAGVDIVGLTAPSGAATIIDEDMLAQADEVVAGMAGTIAAMRCDGVIVGAFGNPGAQRLRKRMGVPVVGLGEAAMRVAARDCGRFIVLTTTPGLVRAIERDAARLGLADALIGVEVTPGDPIEVMGEETRMFDALADACTRAAETMRADAIVVGGGPLAKAAAHLREHVRIPIVEPVSAALCELTAAIGGAACTGTFSGPTDRPT